MNQKLQWLLLLFYTFAAWKGLMSREDGAAAIVLRPWPKYVIQTFADDWANPTRLTFSSRRDGQNICKECLFIRITCCWIGVDVHQIHHCSMLLDDAACD